MNISIIGDSFCDTVSNYPYPSWPYLLKKYYNADILTSGKCGWALYHAYKLNDRFNRRHRFNNILCY